MASAFQRS